MTADISVTGSMAPTGSKRWPSRTAFVYRPWEALLASKIEMDRSKKTGFTDRLSAAAEARKAQLERAARARSAAESPAAVERRAAREAVRLAREARIAERKAEKLAA